MAHGVARQREIERAMRVHPAGSALRVERPDRRGSAPPVRMPVRLTARGRRLLAVGTVTAGVGLASLAGTVLGGADARPLHLAGQSSVVVRPGDTLWSVASSVAGNGDVRVVVARVREANGLHGSDLRPGQVLVLP
jgi:nucleoid-associated protein YgaU